MSRLSFRRRRQVPVILQSEVAECALACLAMVAAFYARDVSLLELRIKHSTSLRGTRLQELLEIGSAIGLVPRPVRVELEDLDQLTLPSILHWDMSHFVVLTRVSSDWIEIIDPAFGRKRLKLSEASRYFTGVAVEFTDSQRMVRAQERPNISLRILAGSVSGLGKGLLQILALALLLELFALLSPQYMRLVIDQVVADRDTGLLQLLGISFAMLLVFKTLVEALRTWLMIWLSTNINAGWTGNVFSHLIRLPLDYFAKRHLGDVLSRFGAISVIQQTITSKFVVVILDGLMALVTAGMLLYYNATMALVVLLLALGYVAIRALYFRALREANLQQINVYAVQQGALIESLRGIQSIRLNNRETERGTRYMNATADALNMGVAVQRLGLLFDSAGGLINGVQRIMVVWFGAALTLKSEMSPGMLVAFVAYADQFTSRFVGLADYLVQFRLLRLQGERLADIVLTQPERYVEGNHLGELKEHNLIFKDVTFRYSGNAAPILDECSFEVAAGQIVAITGESGAGKSTIARVLLGVVDYHSGSVRIGGAEQRAMGKRRVRSLIASVMQDDHLFSGTIFDNVSFFDQEATLEKVQEAVNLVNMGDDISKMPLGLQTLIGDMGSSLSGGQHQRLLLARAMYRKTPILLLDEATSHLDLFNEQQICATIRKLGLTTLIIAHRPQTIESADRVFILRAGKLQEDVKPTIEKSAPPDHKKSAGTDACREIV